MPRAEYLYPGGPISYGGNTLALRLEAWIPRGGMHQSTFELVDTRVLWQSILVEVANCRDQKVVSLGVLLSRHQTFELQVPLGMRFVPSSTQDSCPEANF